MVLCTAGAARRTLKRGFGEPCLKGLGRINVERLLPVRLEVVYILTLLQGHLAQVLIHMTSRTMDKQCSVCGSSNFLPPQSVLWRGLIDEWQLSEEEAHYVDRQQGQLCADCGSNLRSIALSSAILGSLKKEGTLINFVGSEGAAGLKVLELNEAGTLGPHLRKLPGHTFGAYPQVDMHALPYPDGTFDLVIHSDTLEHIENPAHGLRECARVLKTGGAICYTVPVIVGRLTRSRVGLSKSYHGNPAEPGDDFVVHTEFGADFWTLPIQAGLSRVTIYTFEYPAAIAVSATFS